MNDEADTQSASSEDAQTWQLQAINRLHERLATLPEAKDIRATLARSIADASSLRVILLAYNNTDDALEYFSSYPTLTPAPLIYLPLFNAPDDSIAGKITNHDQQVITLTADIERLRSLTNVIGADTQVALVPLNHDKLSGLLVAYPAKDGTLPERAITLLGQIAPLVNSHLRMIIRHDALQKRKDDIEREAEIFSRIDAELSDIIDLNYVFTMLKDWALRFSNADAAALSLYDSETNTLRVMSQYGLRADAITLDEEMPSDQVGLTLRVANSGHSEIVPDVLADAEYYELVEGARTQMSVPIKREEQVIGVLVLYSRKVNGFTDEHLAFVKKLASRAGVALDNARLFTETKREREKQAYILRNISEIVIVVGLDNRLVLINDSARLAFHLADERDYVGRNFNDVITIDSVQQAYHEAVESGEALSTEIELPNKRSYHTTIEQHAGIGHIIVMQDITHFKETDRLKTELVATVSHDLKQPLSVMRGYIDLLQMVNAFDERSQNYINNLNFAFNTMRQLIDDLLDIARIEAGLTLDMEDVSLRDVLDRVSRNLQVPATQKPVNLEMAIPDTLPNIHGDPARLEQIFNNLVGNAIKYTQANGYVKVYVEIKLDLLRVFIEDNGMGIGPEDQAQIFERFYRVRRPETDTIEGTGLGLAIVKSLVEAHHGKIDLKSALGEGSTFRVTLPIS